MIALVMFVYTMSIAQAAVMGEILPAETVTGSVAKSQTDTYTFSGNEGDTVIIRLVGTNNGYFDASIDLYAPDNVLETTVSSNTPQVTLENYQLLQTGTYTIVVKEVDGDHSSDYALSLLTIPGPIVSEQDHDGGSIRSAETKGGIIDLADTDVYTFTANAGDRVLIRLVGTNNGYFDARIDLYAPDNIRETTVTSNTPQITLENYQLLQSGTHTIVVQEFNGDNASNYELSLLKIPGPVVSEQDLDGGNILCGDTKNGIIDLADTDAYTFTAAVGHTVVIRLVGINNGYFDARIDLYAPDGARETNVYSNTPHITLENYQLLQTGTYTIVVHEFNGDNASDYELSLSKIPCAPCTDIDGDGYAIEGGECGPIDCVDDNFSTNPGAEEIYDDGIDNDCDGLTDSDDSDSTGDGSDDSSGNGDGGDGNNGTTDGNGSTEDGSAGGGSGGGSGCFINSIWY
jgi:hypothetical protein